jgi:hypothetical protein
VAEFEERHVVIASAARAGECHGPLPIQAEVSAF